MSNKIQFRRGLQANLPTLDVSEPAFCTDTERLYLGSTSGNILMSIGSGGFDLGDAYDGYVTYYTGQNSLDGHPDFYWDANNSRLGIRTTAPTHALTIDGYITPLTDNINDLGTQTQRWRKLWLGPTSLHISSTAGETGSPFDWSIGIDDTAGNEGNLVIKQNSQNLLIIDPVDGLVSIPSDLIVSGNIINDTLTQALDGYSGAASVEALEQQTTWIQESLDGYATTSSISGIDHNSTAINDILNSLDGYADWDSSRINQIEAAIQTVIGELDGYDDWNESRVSQIENALLTVISDLDGYSSDANISILGSQVTDIQNSLDGYATTSSISGIEHNATAIGDILSSLDGYADWNESRVGHIEGAIQTILGDLDGYSTATIAPGVLDGYAKQWQVDEHDIAIGHIIDSLDGYADENIVNDNSLAIGHILASLDGYSESEIPPGALDGYALASVENQRWVDSSQQRQDIRDALDGYLVSGDISEISSLESAVNDILGSLDGYADWEENRVSDLETAVGFIIPTLDGYSGSASVEILEQQVTDIQNSLDGYATTSSISGINHNASAINDILNSLDGYADWDESRVQQIETAIQTVIGDLDSYADWNESRVQQIETSVQTVINELDAYADWNESRVGQIEDAIQTILNDLDGYGTADIPPGALDGYALQSDLDTLSSQTTDIQNSLDGYALSSVEDQRWIDSSQQRQDIRDALDGYSGGGDTADLEQQTTWIQESLDGYAQQSTVNDILAALDGYDGYSGGGSGDVSQTPGFTGADGYIAFFTGDGEIAGDNDLFFNRAANTLEITKLKITNNPDTGYVLTSDIDGNATWQESVSASSDFDRLVTVLNDAEDDFNPVFDDEGNFVSY